MNAKAKRKFHEKNKAMRTQEQMTERIAFYAAFLSEITKRIEYGAATPEEIFAIAKKHELPEEIITAFFASGKLMAYDVSKSFSPPFAVIDLHPKNKYIFLWRSQPDEDFAFEIHLGKIIAEESESYFQYFLEREFSKSGFSMCKHCNSPFPKSTGINGFCSSECNSIASKKENGKTTQSEEIKKWIELVDNIVFLFTGEKIFKTESDEKQK
jgi:hypothetical protein